jgi:hypothetical protein
VQHPAHARVVVGRDQDRVALAQPELADAEAQRVAGVRDVAAVAIGEGEREPRQPRTKDGARRERRDDAEAMAHST